MNAPPPIGVSVRKPLREQARGKKRKADRDRTLKVIFVKDVSLPAPVSQDIIVAESIFDYTDNETADAITAKLKSLAQLMERGSDTAVSLLLGYGHSGVFE